MKREEHNRICQELFMEFEARIAERLGPDAAFIGVIGSDCWVNMGGNLAKEQVPETLELLIAQLRKEN